MSLHSRPSSGDEPPEAPESASGPEAAADPDDAPCGPGDDNPANVTIDDYEPL
ncbi:MAG: hypothetical protein ACRDNF_13680 [Streptosporangiaceae bacterium]